MFLLTLCLSPRWLYRKHPSVVHEPFTKYVSSLGSSNLFAESTGPSNPSQIRWHPFVLPKEGEIDFIDGLHTIAFAGDARVRNGLSIYIYTANASMERKAFFNSDGHFLIVPQLGSLLITTELGKIYLQPEEIAIIPQGMKFKVDLFDQHARGYVLEVYDNNFVLPNLGPIGANGLANARHFVTPIAAFEEPIKIDQTYKIVCKFQSSLFTANQRHTPFDVVAWHGNYVPYKYA